jgi:hypothetical protein
LRPPEFRGGELFVSKSDVEGNVVMVGVVGVSNGSRVLGFSKFVDKVGAGGSSFARGGIAIDCVPGVVGVPVFGVGG